MPAKLPPNQRILKEWESINGFTQEPGKPILRGVKVLGTLSQNRRRYTTEAKNAALALYEGTKVNINHPQQPQSNRALGDRLGWLTNVRLDGQDIYADLNYNPKHPLAETVEWWATNQPNMLGLSHNAVGQGKDDENGVFVVDKIVNVRSVDLVADPATTVGLFEETMPDAMTNTEPVNPTPDEAASAPDESPKGGSETMEYKIGHLVMEIARDQTMSRSDKRKKLLQALKLAPERGEEDFVEKGLKDAEKPKDKPEKKEEKSEKKEKKAEESVQNPPVDPTKGRSLLESVLAKKREALAQTSNKINELKTVETKRVRLETAKRVCLEAKLPEPLVTEVFLKTLTECQDEAGMKALVEDRLKLADVRFSAPNRLKEHKTMELKEFVSSIR